MGRVRAARALVEKLIRRKQECEQRKKILESYLQRLHESYSKHEISYSRYIEILYKKTNGRTLHKWIEYYEQSIVNCEKEIKRQKRSIAKTQIPVILFSFLFLFLLVNAFFNIGSTFIGFLIQEPTQTFTETLNLQFAETDDYSWTPTNLGTLNYVKLSGNINGKGNVKIYLDDLLILENSNIPSTTITGRTVEEVNEDYSVIKYVTGFLYQVFLTLTGQATEEIPESVKETNESNKSFSEDLNEEAFPNEDSNPSQEEPLPSEEIFEEEIVKKIPDSVKEFIDLCDETCDLIGLNLNKTSYTLRIEISNPNTIVNINEIKYEITPLLKEIIEEPIKEVPEENITEPIIPLENITATIQTTQFQAVIGKPVKWKKDIQLDKQGRVKLTLPKEATNISVFKITEELREKLEEQINVQEEPLSSGETIEEPSSETEPKKNITEVEETTEQTKENVTKEKKQKARFTITAQVVSEKDKSILDYIKEIFLTITGRAIDIQEQVDVKEVTIEDNSTQYEVEYETPAPYAIEEEIEKGKRVKIVGPEDIHYENVLAFTNLSESLNIQNPGSVKIHWVENNTFLPIQTILDTNDNGIYDYVSWVIPRLSNQTFDIIVIIKAEHLNSSREFISDIYEEVRELDGLWSETIPEEDYVRVTFEIPLDNTRDITIFSRIVNGSPRIEVYEFNSSEVIAEFTSLNDNEYNKIFLTNLQGSQDTFDLRVLGGSIEIDHIVDPQNAIPDTDVSQGGWTDEGSVDNDGVFYTSLDEIPADGDLSFIHADSSGDGTFEVNLSGVTDPGVSTGHIMHLNCTASGSGAGEKIDITLRQGGTVINAKNNFACDRTAYVDVLDTLSAGEADAITNYSGLSIRVVMDTLGNGETINITNIYLEVPTLDTEAPKWFHNSTNSTIAGDVVQHRVNWTNSALAGYVFSWTNGTVGNFVNDSFRIMTGTYNWSNVTKVVNHTVGTVIEWKFYVNDTSGNMNVTDTFNYTTTAAAGDSTTPTTVFGINPIDTSNETSSSIVFDFKAFDDTDIDTIRLYGNWTAGGGTAGWHANYTNSSYTNNTYLNITVNPISDGKYVWGLFANDSAGNFNWTSTNRTLTVDTTKPNFIKIQTNTTMAGETANFSIFYNDGIALHPHGQYIFSINQTGAWVNDSARNFTTTGEWANVTKVLNSTIGAVIGYQWYASDNAGNTNNSATFAVSKLTTEDSTPPTFISAQHNTTTAGDTVNFSVFYNDNNALHPNGLWVFSINQTGAWVNDSAVNFTTTGEWTNVTKVLNSTIGAVIGYQWYANDSAGNENHTLVYKLETTSASNAAVTINVGNYTMVDTEVDPTENSFVRIKFFVNVTDTDGNGEINTTSVNASTVFFTGDESTRTNSSASTSYNCISKGQAQSDANTLNFSCSIDLWFFDTPGRWNITVYARDTGNTSNIANTTTTFSYATLQAIVMEPATITFSTIAQGATNITSINDPTPTLMNNTGNANFTVIDINASNLVGNTNSSQIIPASNFSVGNQTGGSAGTEEECGIGQGDTLYNDTILADGVFKIVSNVTLKRGNHSLNNNNTGQEQFFWCLRQTPLDISSQAYSNKADWSWTIRVLLAVVIIPSSNRKKKGKKKRKKRPTIENLTIPSAIFTKKLGCLEAMTKYMKDNLRMSYSEIAAILNRDDRTIWTAYKKAIEKEPETINLEKILMMLPIIKLEKILLVLPVSIFKNKKLTILESIVYYLKQKGLKNSEISKLLNRDQRNIWTLYSRAVKKINSKK